MTMLLHSTHACIYSEEYAEGLKVMFNSDILKSISNIKFEKVFNIKIFIDNIYFLLRFQMTLKEQNVGF